MKNIEIFKSQRMSNIIKDSVDWRQDIAALHDDHSSQVRHDVTIVRCTEHCHHLNINFDTDHLY